MSTEDFKRLEKAEQEIALLKSEIMRQRAELISLRNEIDCRIEHGADGVEHLAYIKNFLTNNVLTTILAQKEIGKTI